VYVWLSFQDMEITVTNTKLGHLFDRLMTDETSRKRDNIFVGLPDGVLLFVVTVKALG